MSKIAVLIPCYNEGTTIGKVVVDFRHNNRKGGGGLS